MLKPWDQFPTVLDVLSADNNPDLAAGNVSAELSGAPLAISIVGAGLAGCWLARILAERGIQVVLFEKNTHVALGASGNPVGIVKPFVTRSMSSGMSFHCLAHECLLDGLSKFKLTAGLHRCGVLQLVHSTYQHSHFYSNLNREASKKFAGIDTHSSALLFNDSGWLNPNLLCNALVQHPNINLRLGFDLVSLDKISQSKHYRLKFSNKQNFLSRHTVFTTGPAIQLLPGKTHIPLRPARGQISHFNLLDDADKLCCVVSGKHYAIPSKDGVYVGATFDRDNNNNEVTEPDHASNLLGLTQLLPELKVQPTATQGYAGIRATTPDRIPLVGPLPDFTSASEAYSDIRHGKALQTYPPLPCEDGLYMIGGLGSRGIVTAPLCAELLANHLMGKGNNMPHIDRTDAALLTEKDIDLNKWASILNPARFLIRQLKRSATLK